MHDSALVSGGKFSQIYVERGSVVVDVGGLDVNGTLRKVFPQVSKYISVDMESGPGVDIVVEPGKPLPFADGSVDTVVSTSCFEHDPCFWMTFREMARIVKVGGYIYINAPSNGPYHGYPGDNWRFYRDAGFSLAHWSGKIVDGQSYPTKVVETFFVHSRVHYEPWIDWVCVWKRETDPVTTISAPYPDPATSHGPLMIEIEKVGCPTRDRQ